MGKLLISFHKARLFKLLNNLFLLIITTLFYILFATFSFEIALVNKNVFSIWVPTGLSLLILYLNYRKTTFILFGIFLGAFILNSFYIENKLSTSFFIAIGNTLGTYIVFYFYRKHIRKNLFILREEKLFYFIFLILIGSIVSSIIGSLSLFIEDKIYSEKLIIIFFTWLIGDFMGYLIIFPIFSFLLDNKISKKQHNFSYSKFTYKILFFIFYFTICIYIFILPKNFEPNGLAFIAIVLLSIPLNFISSGTTLFSFVIMTSCAISGMILGFYHGSPFYSHIEDKNSGLILLQAYLVTSTIIVYTYISILYNKNKAILKLKNSNSKLKETLNSSREKDIILYKNSKKAFIGDMIDSIAHQWRQPLSEINSIIFKLEYQLINKQKLTYLRNDINRLELITTFLSETIDSFRDFIFLTKKRNPFFLYKFTEKTINIFLYSFEKNNIKINNKIDKQLKIISYEKELAQVLLSILQNSIEAYKRLDVRDEKVIVIDSLEEKEFIYLSINDNAGGVKENEIELIMRQDYTTKEFNGGSGLYICSLIMERLFKGELKIRNTQNGLEVILKIKKEEER